MRRLSASSVAAALLIAGEVVWAGCSRGDAVPSKRPEAASPAATGSADSPTPAARDGAHASNGAAPLTPPANVDLSHFSGIPLSDGLVVVIAAVEERGDYEVAQRVSTAGADRIQVSYSATVPVAGTPTELRGQRIVLTRDLQSARIYRVRWLSGRTELARGTTALGLSKDVFDELRKEGGSECSLASIEDAGALIGVTGLPSPEYEGELKRIEEHPVPVAVVLDGQREWLPAIHAKGTFEGLTGDVNAEFWFLDDPQNPLTLRAVIGTGRFIVVRIDRPKAVENAGLERALSAEQSVDLPGVYFEFGSARLRPESNAAIGEVAAVLRRHADWKIRFEGHTDNIGGADANFELSRARAGAVRQAVIEQLGGGAERLDSGGFGPTRPRESNDTPEGRARNRRVEIVRVR